MSEQLDAGSAHANGKLKSGHALYDLHLPQVAQLACLCNLGDGKLDGKAVAVHVQSLQFSGPVDDVGVPCLIVRTQDAIVHLAVRRGHQH